MTPFKSTGEKEEEMATWLDKRGLNDVEENDFEQIKRIGSQLWGISPKDKSAPHDILQAQLCIVEQNWLLIKQNDEIIKLLKKDK